MELPPMELPSSHQIGSIVIFEPRLHLIDSVTRTTLAPEPILAKVMAIRFAIGKVFYDLAVADRWEFYEVNPLKDVDSYMVLPRV